METIILASQSPRRRQLLEWAEIPFKNIVRSTDESFPPELRVEEVPIHIARQKAIEVKRYLEEINDPTLNDKTIVAADTIVVLDSKVIGKPRDREDAITILSSLSGKTH